MRTGHPFRTCGGAQWAFSGSARLAGQQHADGWEMTKKLDLGRRDVVSQLTFPARGCAVSDPRDVRS
jgi:hypothetical protein